MTESAAHQLARSRMYLTVEDIDDIAGLVARLPQNRVVTVVELGAGSGTSALTVLQTRPTNIDLYSIDNDPEALRWTLLNLEGFQKIGGLPAEVDLVASWTPVEGNSAEIGRNWPGSQIDLLLQDARHDYEGVLEDLRAWLPLVRKGASNRRSAFWVHDYKEMPGAAETYPGVAQAIDQAHAEGLFRDYTKGNDGIGFIGYV